jgi:hypothetical protein
MGSQEGYTSREPTDRHVPISRVNISKVNVTSVETLSKRESLLKEASKPTKKRLHVAKLKLGEYGNIALGPNSPNL